MIPAESITPVDSSKQLLRMAGESCCSVTERGVSSAKRQRLNQKSGIPANHADPVWVLVVGVALDAVDWRNVHTKTETWTRRGSRD